MALSFKCNRLTSITQQLEQSIGKGDMEEAKKALEKIKEEWDILDPLMKVE